MSNVELWVGAVMMDKDTYVDGFGCWVMDRVGFGLEIFILSWCKKFDLIQ